MLELRYNKNTKELTGWWGNRHGNFQWIPNPQGYSKDEIILLETKAGKRMVDVGGFLSEVKTTLYKVEGTKLKNRPNEVLVLLDIPIPDKSPSAWLFDTDKLIPNPAYVEPEPTRDLLKEIDELTLKLKQARVI